MKSRFFSVIFCCVLVFNATCLQGYWSNKSDTISEFLSDKASSALAVNDQGMGLVVYCDDGTLKASEYNEALNQWEKVGDNAITLSDGDVVSVTPDVVLDGKGSGFAVWVEGISVLRTVRTARYNGSTGLWDTIQDLSLPGEFLDPKIAVDGSGNASVIWGRKLPLGKYMVEVVHFDAKTESWDKLATTLVLDVDLSNPPRILMDSAGDAVAFWFLREKSNDIVQGSRCASGAWTSLGEAIVDHSSRGELYGKPSIEINSNGDGLAIWVVKLGSKYYTHTTWFDKSSTIEEMAKRVVSLAAPSANPVDVDVSVDEAGNGLAVWSWGAKGRAVVQSAEFAGETKAWINAEGLAVTISENIKGSTNECPKVALDKEGNGIAVWNRILDKVETIVSAKYSAAKKSWVHTDMEVYELSQSDKTNVGLQFLHLARNPSGQAIATWKYKGNDFTEIQSNIYLLSKLDAKPKNAEDFEGRERRAYSPLYKAHIHELTWSPSTDDSVVGYVLRANGKVVARMSIQEPCGFILLHDEMGVCVKYTLSSYNAEGVESDPVELTLC